MGFSMSWVAVRGRSSDEVRRALKLSATGEREEIPESALVGATLPGGWALLIANGSERFIQESLLARLSRGCEAVACFVEEHVMVSQASGWVNGRNVWAVDHDGSDGPGQLEVSGAPPEAFAAIRTDLERRQRMDGEVDWLFEAPVDLARALVGFRHDQDVPGMTGDLFEVLAG